MNKVELIRTIKDGLEDVIIYQNKRSIKSLVVSVSKAYEYLGITSEDLVGVELVYSHLDKDKCFKIHQRTSRGITLVK